MRRGANALVLRCAAAPLPVTRVAGAGTARRGCLLSKVLRAPCPAPHRLAYLDVEPKTLPRLLGSAALIFCTSEASSSSTGAASAPAAAAADGAGGETMPCSLRAALAASAATLGGLGLGLGLGFGFRRHLGWREPGEHGLVLGRDPPALEARRG